jgi:hypothetical protein
MKLIGIILLILVILILGCQKYNLNIVSPRVQSCTNLYNEIDAQLKNSNYCETDSDCDTIMLGGQYIEFGCYHYINKNIDKDRIYEKMIAYNANCSKMINDCGIAPKSVCVSGKCESIKDLNIT